jgi:hypothetical protein
MTLVERLPEGDLYFYSDFSCQIWLVVGNQSVIVAYHGGESPEQIITRVREWHSDLVAGIKPKDNSGYSVFGAYRDPADGGLKIVWFNPGDWMAIPAHLPLPEHRDQLPACWPEENRKRIEKLLLQRSQHAE